MTDAEEHLVHVLPFAEGEHYRMENLISHLKGYTACRRVDVDASTAERRWVVALEDPFLNDPIAWLGTGVGEVRFANNELQMRSLDGNVVRVLAVIV